MTGKANIKTHTNTHHTTPHHTQIGAVLVEMTAGTEGGWWCHFPSPHPTPAPESQRHTFGYPRLREVPFEDHCIILSLFTLYFHYSIYRPLCKFYLHVSRKEAYYDNSYHILSTYFVLACLLSALQTLFHLLHPRKLLHHPILQGKETKAYVQRPTPDRWQGWDSDSAATKGV